MGIAPIADINEQIEAIVETIADMHARHGPFGTFQDERKIVLSKIKAVLFVESVRDKRKMTGDMADAEAHAHPEYIDFVTKASTDRATLFRALARIDSLERTYNRGQLVGKHIARLG